MLQGFQFNRKPAHIQMEQHHKMILQQARRKATRQQKITTPMNTARSRQSQSASSRLRRSMSQNDIPIRMLDDDDQVMTSL